MREKIIFKPTFNNVCMEITKYDLFCMLKFESTVHAEIAEYERCKNVFPLFLLPGWCNSIVIHFTLF